MEVFTAWGACSAPIHVMAGVLLRQVQILAGHAIYATAEKFYVHLTPKRDDGAQGAG
ncbi:MULTISPECIES: hypothetical protein [unclassified Stenotrophomonas]|uniref:hypothetical protein n=1 Tax=unclassified Stenotrophomonas TaxID=196198 RepID=UPI001F38AAC1|nr:hypothetical protein [Stenotrophomonas sp. AG209]